MKLSIAADVLDRDRNLKEVLSLADTFCRCLNRLEGVRDRKEVVGIATVDTPPAKMIGQPRSPGPARQVFQALEVSSIERLRGAEVHRYSMLDDAVSFEDLVED